MTVKIKELERFQEDCLDYQTRIKSIQDDNKRKQAEVMYETFLNSVDAVDASVDNLAQSGPVFGNEHNLLRENLHRSRLDLIRWLKKHSPIEKTNPIPMNG